MKSIRFCAALLFLTLAFPPVTAAAADAPETSAGAMILYHAPSGTVLSQRNAESRALIASTTKLMTALVVLERCDISAAVVIDPAWTQVEGSSMYLRPGEEYTLRELLTGLLLASGNDAALSLACATAGSVEEFALWMNEKAAELGLRNTRFANPHGLDAEGHYSCARDLAVIMGAALENPTFREIDAQAWSTVHGVTYKNHNRLLTLCPGATGGKTGYTRSAGRCLVSSCERDGLELICVTLNDKNDWADHCALYDWAFAHYAAFSIERGAVLARLPTVGAPGETAAVAGETLRLCLPRDSSVAMTAELPHFVLAPVTPGEAAGWLKLYGEERLLAEVPLVWS